MDIEYGFCASCSSSSSISSSSLLSRKIGCIRTGVGGQINLGDTGGGTSTTTVDTPFIVIELEDDRDDVDNRDVSFGFVDANGWGGSQLE